MFSPAVTTKTSSDIMTCPPWAYLLIVCFVWLLWIRKGSSEVRNTVFHLPFVLVGFS